MIYSCSISWLLMKVNKCLTRQTYEAINLHLSLIREIKGYFISLQKHHRKLITDSSKCARFFPHIYLKTFTGHLMVLAI